MARQSLRGLAVRLTRWLKSPVHSAMFALGAAGVILFVWLGILDQRLGADNGFGIVDLELARNADTARRIVESWGTSDLLATAGLSITLDFLFLISYALVLWYAARQALAGAIARSATAHHMELPSWTGRLPLLPLLAGGLDALENLGMLRILSDTPQGSGGTLSALVTVAATLKFLLLSAFALALAWILLSAFAPVVRGAIDRLRSVVQLLMLVRFSILLFIIGIACLFIPQWLEILRALTPDRALWLAFASLLAAFSTWYSARVMYMFRFDEVAASEPSRHRFLKTWLPRALGAFMPLLVVASIVRAHPDDGKTYMIAIAAQLIALAMYLSIVICRRHIGLLSPGAPRFGEVDHWTALPGGTRRALLALLILNTLMFCVFLLWPRLAQVPGGATLVLMAAASILPAGSFVVYLGSRFHVPSVTIVVLLAFLFSLVNDNHKVRLYADMPSTLGGLPLPAHPPATGRGLSRTLHGYLQDWAQQRCTDGRTIPLFIVSAEGGGIRAAYWTAHVLASITDLATREGLDFVRHLFAISGVSGGSLGATAFVALAGQDRGDPGRPFSGLYQDHLHRFLDEDFLSPTIATMLFPDLLQRFIPVPVFSDRAATMERSWERAWEKTFPGAEPVFGQPFTTLWSGGDTGAPLLFLNSTVVETGDRLIVHPLKFPAQSDEPFVSHFSHALDGREILGEEIPLSTAVHLSARFTYVSPAGTVGRRDLQTGDRLAWIRLVDGGYFENSATVTSTEILQAIRESPDTTGCPLAPFIIHISNEPVVNEPQSFGEHVLMGEVLSPLRALLNVRPARGFQARDALQRIAGTTLGGGHGQTRFVHFLLFQREVQLPLGWMLSTVARTEIESQLPDGEAGDDSDIRVEFNIDKRRTVLEFLRCAAAPPGASPDTKNLDTGQCR